MTKQSKFKSIFILHVYKYGGWEPKDAYLIDKDYLECKGVASLGIDIWDYEVGYSQNLRAAEKRIKKIAAENQEWLYRTCCYLEFARNKGMDDSHLGSPSKYFGEKAKL